MLKLISIPLLIIVILVGIFWGISNLNKASSQCLSTERQHCALRVSVADTMATQEKGLGGRLSLPQNQGMLFSFNNESTHCFWMKDMHFSLDMLWIGQNKQIESIESNVSPSSYPTTYCPNVAAKYVLEINAGEAQALGLNIGQPLYF